MKSLGLVRATGTGAEIPKDVALEVRELLASAGGFLSRERVEGLRPKPPAAFSLSRP